MLQAPEALDRKRSRLNTRQRVRVVQLFQSKNGNVRAVRAEWRNDAERSRPPLPSTIRDTVARFDESGAVTDRPRSGRRRTATTAEAMRTVRESILNKPMLSTGLRARAIGFSRSSLMRIQRRDIGALAYKLQVVQPLKQTDFAARSDFGLRLLALLRREPQAHRQMIMGDEAHFLLSGGVFNKQNVRFWGTENPRLVRQHDEHAVRATVWCGVSAHGVLGPYFFENERGVAVSVTGERYRRMLVEYVRPLLRDNPRFRRVPRWWWQQDGATAHTAYATMNILNDMFGADRLISRNSNFHWPARSPDLGAPDFFLWGYLKDRVYKTATNGDEQPRTLDELKRNIRREVATLNEPASRSILRAVMDGVVERARLCVRTGGRHLADVLFHT